jgi:hypothetical protein
MTSAQLVEHFKSQLDVAEPVTSEVLEEMRQSRIQLATEQGMEEHLPASLALLDGREGQRQVFYMHEKKMPGALTSTISVLNVWDADLEQLSTLEYVNMAGKFPRFKDAT